MTTPSLREEGGGLAPALPLSFDRTFRPWSYKVSHSELKFRSVDHADSDDLIEITFYGVVGMRLKTAYRSITIAYADPIQTEELCSIAGLGDRQRLRLRYIAVKSDDGDALIACLSYSIWLHPREVDYDGSGVPHRGSTLILRG